MLGHERRGGLQGFHSQCRHSGMPSRAGEGRPVALSRRQQSGVRGNDRSSISSGNTDVVERSNHS